MRFRLRPGRSAGGPLTDPTASKGEQDATQFLFVGAYGVLRNPAGHREIDYADISEAAEGCRPPAS